MELPTDTVDIHLTRIIDVPGALLADYHALMSRDEQARNRRFRRGPLRDANTITRALLRCVLSEYGDYPPERWEFATREHGRPFIASPEANLHFNLSHTIEWIACAVARMPVIGIDIERCSRNVAVPRLAERFFSTGEYHDVLARSGEDRRHRFFEYWTLKEAYIKARGEGITLGLDSFSFRISDSGAICIECEPRLQDDPSAWHFRLSPRMGDHRLALAVKPDRPSSALTVRQFLTIPALSTEPYRGPMWL